MKISKIELFHISIPCLTPFETSFGKITERPALIIRMESDDGLFGLGESSPLSVPISEPETIATALPLLQKILPTLIGLPVEEGFDIRASYKDIVAPVSLIGIEGAYLDLLAKRSGISVANLLGSSRSEVELGESVSLYDSHEKVIETIERYHSEGIERIKVKIAPGRDIEVVRAARERFPNLALAADANAAYTAEDIEHLSQLVAFNLSFVEQPFKVDDLQSHATLRLQGIPVALDESIVNLESCIAAIELGACDFINIKPARIGSFAEAKQIHNFALSRGIGLFGGGRLETGVGKTMNAHFYALPGFTSPSDITEPKKYLGRDIVMPAFKIENALYKISSAPGLGIELDTESITPYLIDHIVFERN